MMMDKLMQEMFPLFSFGNDDNTYHIWESLSSHRKSSHEPAEVGVCG